MPKFRGLRRLFRAPSQRAKLEAEIKDLTDDVKGCFEHYLSLPEPSAVDGHEHLLASLAAWTMFIYSGIDAVRRLQACGLGLHAVPIRRNLSEHAITCFVVAEEPRSFDSLLRNFQHEARKHLDAAEAAGIGTGDLERDIREVLTWEIDDSSKSLDLLAQTKEKFRLLTKGGDRLYAQWLQDTALSHANPGTAGIFLRATEGSEYPTLVSSPVLGDEEWFVEAACADALLLAIDSLSAVTVGDPLRQSAEELNRKQHRLLDELDACL